jgi:hypothetical protein
VNVASPVHVDFFYHDGRGPELRCIHWAHDGRILVAADYSNHDDYGERAARHIRFERVQVVQVTAEEVIAYGALGAALTKHRPAAMFDLGKSAWLRSFSPRHLEHCRHFQLVFYDELLDVICERVTCHVGSFQAG